VSDDRLEQDLAVVENIGEPCDRAVDPDSFQGTALLPRVPYHVVAVDREQVEGDERERDRPVAVQHALAEQRPMRSALLVESGKLAIEHEPGRQRT
jgi:hypothetical protein